MWMWQKLYAHHSMLRGNCLNFFIPFVGVNIISFINLFMPHLLIRRKYCSLENIFQSTLLFYRFFPEALEIVCMKDSGRQLHYFTCVSCNNFSEIMYLNDQILVINYQQTEANKPRDCKSITTVHHELVSMKTILDTFPLTTAFWY